MTRQEQFKAKLNNLLAEYRVEMSNEYGPGVSFFAFAEHNEEGNIIKETIDLFVPNPVIMK